MPHKILRCLVTITRSSVADSRVVKCVLDGSRFLVIPVEDFALPQADGRREMMLKVPDDWFAEVDGVDHDLICRKVIDLDKFDELSWADIPPPLA